MSSLNKHVPVRLTETNSAGTPVRSITEPLKQLTRLTLAHMLWEDSFYVGGRKNSEMLADAVKAVPSDEVAKVALLARTKFKLRHVPLALMSTLAKTGGLKANQLTDVIRRPDEMSEFLSMYWKDGKVPISNQVKKGLAGAFGKFNEYSLAKWDKNSAAISLRDVMFLTHPKPQNPEQEALFKKVAAKELATPNTWETRLSAGADKRATFEDLMRNNELGALAFIRNLRNMVQAGVNMAEIVGYSRVVSVENVLPFRFISAMKQVPSCKDMLEAMMLRALEGKEKLPGHTVLVVDCSGSMHQRVSAKSDLSALDAALALAMLARELCETVTIYATAGSDGRRQHATVKVPSHLRGFALAEYINSYEVRRAIGGGGIFLVQVMKHLSDVQGKVDRVMVFTDEQDTGGRGFEPHLATRIAPAGRNYILNVATNKNGINSAQWETITGFSEACFDYIQIVEGL